jgi:hypothetical protein
MGLAWEDTMINATEYRAMVAEHHRLAGMCRSPDSREQHLRLEQQLRVLAEREESLAPAAGRAADERSPGRAEVHPPLNARTEAKRLRT